MEGDVLCYDGTEPRSPHSDVRVRPTTDLHNLGPDVLSLPITVRPNHEHLCTGGLRFQVFGDSLRVFFDLAIYGSFEQQKWVAGGPFRVHGCEVVVHNVPSYSGNRELGVRLGV